MCVCKRCCSTLSPMTAFDLVSDNPSLQAIGTEQRMRDSEIGARKWRADVRAREVEQAVVVAAVKIIARNGPPCLTTSELLFTLFKHTLTATHASNSIVVVVMVCRMRDRFAHATRSRDVGGRPI
jgi:hypothetical protein